MCWVKGIIHWSFRKWILAHCPPEISASTHSPCLVCWFKYSSWFLLTLVKIRLASFHNHTSVEHKLYAKCSGALKDDPVHAYLESGHWISAKGSGNHEANHNLVSEEKRKGIRNGEGLRPARCLCNIFIHSCISVSVWHPKIMLKSFNL